MTHELGHPDGGRSFTVVSACGKSVSAASPWARASAVPCTWLPATRAS
jgi:hypothetical protein